MALTRTLALNPRKTPVQSRSAVTLDAIYEAAIQVLLAEGAKRTTTIRVAERAGVSVGTLYQYHANIQSLMASVIEKHVGKVTEAVDDVCRANHGKPVKVMLRAFVDAFVDAKTENVDVSNALYAIFTDLNCREILDGASDRMTKTVQSMLATAKDCEIEDLKTAARMIVAVQAGPIRDIIQSDASSRSIRKAKEHLFLICFGYIRQLTDQ